MLQNLAKLHNFKECRLCKSPTTIKLFFNDNSLNNTYYYVSEYVACWPFSLKKTHWLALKKDFKFELSIRKRKTDVQKNWCQWPCFKSREPFKVIGGGSLLYCKGSISWKKSNQLVVAGSIENEIQTKVLQFSNNIYLLINEHSSRLHH